MGDRQLRGDADLVSASSQTRIACAFDRSHSSKAAGRSASSGLPWQAAGRSHSTQPLRRSPVGPMLVSPCVSARPSCTSPFMTMDQFFDTVVAEMRNDEATLKNRKRQNKNVHQLLQTAIQR